MAYQGQGSFVQNGQVHVLGVSSVSIGVTLQIALSTLLTIVMLVWGRLSHLHRKES